MKRNEFFKKIVRNEKARTFFQRFIYGRTILTFLMLLAQIVLIIFLCVRLQAYKFYFISSMALSLTVMIVLSNIKGKNEFKIAWIVPVIIFPLFGVVAYILYHTNLDALHIKKDIKKLKNYSKKYIKSPEKVQSVIEKNPKITDLQTYFYKTCDLVPYENNKVSYYSCGEEFFPDLCKEISKAKKFIFIEFFIIALDESWATILDLLEKKVKEGVEVRVIFDGFGSIVTSYSNYQKYLAEQGIKTLVFLPIVPILSTKQNNRDHRKIIVVDGKTAFTGGLNIKNEYFNHGKNRFPYWKDNAVKIEGESVNSFTNMFLQIWNIGKKTVDDFSLYFVKQAKKRNVDNIVIPYDDNAFNDQDIAESVYIYLIMNARKYIHITTPYLLLDNNLREALIFAANRGVEVSIMLPSKPDHLLTFCVGKTFLPELLEQGINIYIYERGFLHAKTFICDDEMATVGSVNLDYRSLQLHFECGAFIYDKNLVPQIEKDFIESENYCKKMNLSDYKKIPFLTRFFGRVFRIFAPLL